MIRKHFGPGYEALRVEGKLWTAEQLEPCSEGGSEIFGVESAGGAWCVLMRPEMIHSCRAKIAQHRSTRIPRSSDDKVMIAGNWKMSDRRWRLFVESNTKRYLYIMCKH